MEKEEEYVKALSEGDSKAFEILFLRYQPRLVAFFAGFVHDDEVARDMAQDLFFGLWTNRERLSEVRSFSSYLYRMARNALYNYYDVSIRPGTSSLSKSVGSWAITSLVKTICIKAARVAA